MVSPCISICKMTLEGYCAGCYRTANEIRDWRTLTEDQQRNLIDILRERKGLPKRRK